MNEDNRIFIGDIKDDGIPNASRRNMITLIVSIIRLLQDVFVAI